ncbi:unnamed protein product [Soboliphyme baturini]|uniref:Uncharacterized protein n=1 Tax=Soboliphyme baturini TaxID=241478 RepID=A0A183IIN1_9BILA|nr:unnamed protein product [Soboliphyme baturini]
MARAVEKCAKNLSAWEEICSCKGDYCNTMHFMKEALKKMHEPKGTDVQVAGGGVTNIDVSDFEDMDAVRGSKKGSKGKQLILLLVVIPLGVGGLAVCLIFINYHCKMC